MNNFFPLFVSLQNKKILVVGGGAVAERKIEKLTPFLPEITVVAPVVRESIARNPYVKEIVRRNFVLSDLQCQDFVIVAAPNMNNLHSTIFDEATRQGLWCNSVDSPQYCHFLFPALVTRDDLTIGICTSGKAPSVAAALRRWVERVLPVHISNVIEKISELRNRKVSMNVILAETDILMTKTLAENQNHTSEGLYDRGETKGH